MTDGLSHGGNDTEVVGTDSEAVGISSRYNGLAGSVVLGTEDGVLRHAEAERRVESTLSEGALELLAAHKSVKGCRGNCRSLDGVRKPGDDDIVIETDNEGVTIVDVGRNLVNWRGASSSVSAEIGPNASSSASSGNGLISGSGCLSPGGSSSGGIARSRGGNGEIEGGLRGEDFRLQNLSAHSTVVGVGTAGNLVGAVDIGGSAEFEVCEVSGEIHLVLDGGHFGTSDVAISGDVSIFAGNTQNILSSESCGRRVRGSPVGEADVGVEGNNCDLLIVQRKSRSEDVGSPPGAGGDSVRADGARCNSYGGGAEGRHTVDIDRVGEGRYSHLDCGIIIGGCRIAVTDQHTGVVNRSRGGGGGDHEGSPTRRSGSGRWGSSSWRHGIDVALEAAALLKSQYRCRCGNTRIPAVSNRSSATYSIRVDGIESALIREDEGNDLARDGTSLCSPFNGLGGCLSNSS